MASFQSKKINHCIICFKQTEITNNYITRMSECENNFDLEKHLINPSSVMVKGSLSITIPESLCLNLFFQNIIF